MILEQIIERLKEDKAASIAEQLTAPEHDARIFERGVQAGLAIAITLLETHKTNDT